MLHAGQSLPKTHTREWWEEAFTYGMNENAWYFGVDGIDKKSELYRIGSNFDEVWKTMQTRCFDGCCYCLAIYCFWL